jgi:hypothetical protein
MDASTDRFFGEYLDGKDRDEWTRRIIDAAAPYMASAWHDAVSKAYVEGSLSADQANIMWHKNPYRSRA